MRRRRRLGLRPGALSTLAVGGALAVFYLLMLAVTAGLGSPPRPIYDGICPNGCGPTVCPPPQSSCGPSYAPYTPPPAPTRAPPSQGGPPTTKPRPSQGGAGSAPPGATPAGPTAAATTTPGPTPTAAGSPTAGAQSAQVGSSGGQASSADGSARLVVPAGAVSGPTTFALTALKAGPPIPAGLAQTGPVYDLSAVDAAGQPLTVFRKPILLQLKYTSQPPAFIYYWDGEAWLQTPTTIDAGQHLASTQTPHLTPFVGLARGAVQVGPAPAGVPVPLVVGGLLLVGGAIAASAVAVRRLAPAPAVTTAPTEAPKASPKRPRRKPE